MASGTPLIASVMAVLVAAVLDSEVSFADPGYAPKALRWDEDYQYLTDFPRPLPFPLGLKYIPLGSSDDGYASFGGEYRLQIDDYRHPDFGLHDATSFTSVQQRFLLHSDVHTAGGTRLFLQLGDYLEHGRKPTARPFDRSHIDLAQGFADFTWGSSFGTWRLRLGRQEVSLGRYVTLRDGTNIRRTFDGGRVDGVFSGWSITGLAARATRNRPNSFDDDPDPSDAVALAVIEHAIPLDGLRLGLALIEHENKVATYAVGIGEERRKTLGVRVYGSRGRWDVDAHASYQMGTLTPRTGPALEIRAWGAAFEGGKVINMPWSPRIALRVGTASGDKDTKDGKLGTFDLPYPNFTYLTPAAIFAPRNVRDIQPFLTIAPAARWTLTSGSQFLWRNSTADAVYSSSNLPVIGVGGAGYYIATQPYVRAALRVSPLIEVLATLERAIPGKALKSFGGTRNLDYAMASLSIKF
jgi:hypothetical protein